MTSRPKGASAVMASRAPREIELDSAKVALHRRLEFYPTPPWAARAGAELVLRLDPGRWVAWEPACGQGHMAEAVRDQFAAVFASDVHDHGWERQDAVADFLDLATDNLGVEVDWIVTNPPFETAAEFVRLGLRRARRGVAMLCRLNWIESAGRYPLFFGDTPLTVFAPFAERVPMVLGRWDPGAGSATGYAWFVWIKGDALDCARPSWMTAWDVRPPPVVLPIPPGTKARLTHPDDARLWGAKTAAPLFEGVEP